MYLLKLLMEDLDGEIDWSVCIDTFMGGAGTSLDADEETATISTSSTIVVDRRSASYVSSSSVVKKSRSKSSGSGRGHCLNEEMGGYSNLTARFASARARASSLFLLAFSIKIRSILCPSSSRNTELSSIQVSIESCVPIVPKVPQDPRRRIISSSEFCELMSSDGTGPQAVKPRRLEHPVTTLPISSPIDVKSGPSTKAKSP